MDERPHIGTDGYWSNESGAVVSKALDFEGLHAEADDYVIVDSEVVKLSLCGRLNTSFFVLGTSCPLILKLSVRSVVVGTSDRLRLVWMSSGLVRLAKC